MVYTTEEIKNLLYDEVTGLFTKFRNHQFEALNEEVKSVLLDYAKELNRKMKDATIKFEEMRIIVDLIHNIHALDYANDNEIYMKNFSSDYDEFYSKICFELMRE